MSNLRKNTQPKNKGVRGQYRKLRTDPPSIYRNPPITKIVRLYYKGASSTSVIIKPDEVFKQDAADYLGVATTVARRYPRARFLKYQLWAITPENDVSVVGINSSPSSFLRVNKQLAFLEDERVPGASAATVAFTWPRAEATVPVDSDENIGILNYNLITDGTAAAEVDIIVDITVQFFA